MQTLKEPSSHTTGFNEEISKLTKQQNLSTAISIANLPFFNNQSEVIKSLEEIKSNIKKETGIEITTTAPGGFSINPLKHCFTPPFTGGNFFPADLTPYDADGCKIKKVMPNTVDPRSTTDQVWKVLSKICPRKGEIGLAAVCGQNVNILYPGDPFQILPNIPLGYYNEANGSIFERIEFTPYSYANNIEIKLNIELPQNISNAVELYSESNDPVIGDLRGLLGVEGYIDLIVEYYGGGIYKKISHSTKFLDAWKIHDTDMLPSYDANPVCKLSFTLPAGVSTLMITVLARVKAHSDWLIDVARDSSDQHTWALVDFRGDLYPVYNIRNDYYEPGIDHAPAAAIKIKAICIDSEPDFAVINQPEI